MQDNTIIFKGTGVDTRVDYYCHKYLGGCGTAFYAPPSKSRYLGDGDYTVASVICPGCKQNMLVEVFEPNTLHARQKMLYGDMRK